MFQPHRFSRTELLLDAFGPAFHGADAIVLTDIYAAGEAAIPGITVERLADSIRAGSSSPVELIKDLADVPAAVAQLVRSGDLVITLGAGSIGTVGDKILDAIRARAVRARA